MPYQFIRDIPRSIFRAYDIRGVAHETLTENAVYTIAYVFARTAQAQGVRSVIMARDTRLSSNALGDALRTGLLHAGCDVIDIGEVPTPLLYFATTQYPDATGIMLTGSHNPKQYNGLKSVLQGSTLSEADIQTLYTQIQTTTPDVIQNGLCTERNIIPEYIARIISDVHLDRPLRVILDTGNGVAGNVAPQLFRNLGCDVTTLFEEIDGNFPNHHPDPSEPHNLQALIDAVAREQADIGLAFDGDADRLGVITNKGEIIWPDRQLILYAQDVLSRHPGAPIIYDVKCTRQLDASVRAAGGIPLMWKTGHSLIKAKLKETNAPLAGEMSGHVFFKDRWFGFDDALYTGARLLEIIASEPHSAHERFAKIPNSVNTPELKLSVPDAEKYTLMQALLDSAKFGNDVVVNTIDGIRVDYKDGFGLIRPSNTTPCLVLRFEADNSDALHRIQSHFRQWISETDGNLEIPF